MILSERLEQLKEERNIKHKEVAIAIGVKPEAYSKYVRGTRQPDLETLIKIADYFDVSIDYLIGRDEKSYPNKVVLQGHLKSIENELLLIKKHLNQSK